MNLKKFKPISMFVCFIICFLLFSQAAYAYDLIDTGRKASLEIYFNPDGKNAANAEFKLYKAAEVSKYCEFTLSDKFNKYSLSLVNLDADGWRALAQTMAGYAASDEIAPDEAMKTDSSGKASFTELDTGLYLVTGSSYRSGNYTYTPAPFLVCLPNYGENNTWQYDVTANVKFDSTYHGGGGGDTTLTRKVLKAWKNDDKENRPESVSVTLLKSGKAYETVTLNEKNNWRHTWSGLSSGFEWQVVENDVPENYTVTVSKEGITFLVTNTYSKPGEPDKPDNPDTHDTPDTPDKPDKPDTPDTPDKPDTPSNPDKPNIPIVPSEPDTPPDVNTPPEEPSVPETPPAEKLPQTGLLWWPVPILAICGVVVFMTGWIKQRTDGENDEK